MSQTDSSETKKAMKNLQSGWYNAICSDMNLSSDSFQLVQASQPIEYTSSSLERLFDAIPPKSVAYGYDPSQHNSFYDQYKSIIGVLKHEHEGGDEWKREMGDKLSSWNEYKQNHQDQLLNKGLVEGFREWAFMNMDPGKARRVASLFKEKYSGGLGTIAQAQEKLEEYSPDGNVPEYDHGDTGSGLVDALTSALKHGKPEKISFDSSKASTSVQNTWAEGEVGGLVEFFEGAGGSEFDKLSKQAASQQVTIEASFDHVISFSAAPSRKWYDSSALSIAYNNNNQRVWPAESMVSWESAFGDGGSLRRAVSDIVAFDGIDMTVTSHANYSESQQQHIHSAGEIAIWPFFVGSAAHGQSSHVSFTDDGAMKVHTKLPVGNPNMLGVNVDGIEALVGGG